MNSRPIRTLSDDINDVEALTPGHFLIGQPLIAIPEEGPPPGPVSRLSRLRLLQKMTQDIWKKWHLDYVHALQSRKKWKTLSNQEINCGDLVLIKDPNSAPQSWKLGRITSSCPDSKGISRVFVIQTSRGPTKRSINQIVKLPTEDLFEGDVSSTSASQCQPV